MVIKHPFPSSDYTEREHVRPETEGLIFAISAETERSLARPKPRFGYFWGIMNSLPPSLQSAVLRARWLAELASALDQASKLTLRLSDYCNGSGEGNELRAQILALGTEVEMIQRRARPVAREIGPEWLQ